MVSAVIQAGAGTEGLVGTALAAYCLSCFFAAAEAAQGSGVINISSNDVLRFLHQK